MFPSVRPEAVRGTLVGAPLVTPGTPPQSANRVRPQTEFLPANGEPASGPDEPRHPARYPGDMNVAPTWVKRGGATCDARCRHGTMESVREWNYAANGNLGIRPQMGTPAFACPGESRPLSGRHECRSYVGGLRKTCGGAICDARCRQSTTKRPRTEFRRKRNSVANGKPRHSPAPANPTRHPGDMNVAPTWADCGRPVGAPLVTPGAGTAQWNPPQTANRGICLPRRIPPVIRAT